MVGLKPKQAAFVREYLIDLNATQAAIRAGYSAKTAGVQGHDLLKKPEIAAALAAKTEKATQKAEITAEEVLRGLKLEASGGGEDTNISGRVAAWGLLGKYLKLFTDKTELTGEDGGPVRVSVAINRTVAK